MSKKTTSKAQKAQYSNYKSNDMSRKNRQRKLEKYCRENPNDKKAEAHMLNGVAEYRRYTPYTKRWSKPMIRFAQMLASVGLNGNMALPKK